MKTKLKIKFLEKKLFRYETLHQLPIKNNYFININILRIIMEFAKKFMTEKAEKLNGKAAMLGMFALIGAYYFTGQIVPGIF